MFVLPVGERKEIHAYVVKCSSKSAESVPSANQKNRGGAHMFCEMDDSEAFSVHLSCTQEFVRFVNGEDDEANL